MRSPVLLLLAAAGALLSASILYACSSDPNAIRDRLVATSASFETVPGSTLTLSLASFDFTLTADCNTTGGHYVIADGRFMTSGMAQTAMGCPADQAREDRSVYTFFQSSPRLTTNGDTWTFANHTDTVVFVRQ